MTNKNTVRFFNETQSLIQGNPDLRDPQVEGWISTRQHFRSGSEHTTPQIPVGCGRMDLMVLLPFEIAQDHQVYDIHEKNLGDDITSLHLNSGELSLIDVKDLAAAGAILLTTNEQRMAEDRRDCYLLNIVTNCTTKPMLQEPVNDPARLEWHEVNKATHYCLSVNAMTSPKQMREDKASYGQKEQQ